MEHDEYAHPRALKAGSSLGQTRVRKRTPNAHMCLCSCKRCRQHKIKCTGSQPCAHCQRRKIPCVFDGRSDKVLVTRGWLSDLEKQATQAERSRKASSIEPSRSGNVHESVSTNIADENVTGSPTPASHLGIEEQSESSDLEDSGETHTLEGQRLTNFLVSDTSAYYTPVSDDKTYWLGTSSNWSFARRVLTLAHNKVFGNAPLPHDILHFDGSTYELGWNGIVDGSALEEYLALPTREYARFLINAVQYHCGQLFHIFDELDFMQHFETFHQGQKKDVSIAAELWYIHYLLVLALGKALLGRPDGKRPPGADIFVHAMKKLPSMLFLWTRPVESVEILCCAVIYLECVDLRIVAYNYIGQAIRLAIANGWHTDGARQYHTEGMLERCHKIWWTVYTLDCHMSVLQGVPTSLNERSINARLPTFDSDQTKSSAIQLHVKFAKIVAFIQQTVYCRYESPDDSFLKSIKMALKLIAKANVERAEKYPLHIDDTSNGISRLAAHFYLFHQQAIILTTKPLLFFFFKKRLEAEASFRIPAPGGIRALARISVGSAQQILKTLTALRSQDLLESFIPFDLESVWHATLVLLVSRAVDPSVCKNYHSSLQIVRTIMNDMTARGNLIAACRKAELEHLDNTLSQLDVAPQSRSVENPLGVPNYEPPTWDALTHPDSGGSQYDASSMPDWNIEEILSGAHLEEVADALDLSGLDWLTDTQHPIDLN